MGRMSPYMARFGFWRVIVEWGAIASSTLALLCLLLWGISTQTDVADFQTYLPFGRFNAMPVTVHKGTVSIGNHPGSREIAENIAARGMAFNPPPEKTWHWDAMGVRFFGVQLGGQLTCFASISLLLPGLLLIPIAGACMHQYRQIRRRVLLRESTTH
jgi:hypothetical protein